MDPPTRTIWDLTTQLTIFTNRVPNLELDLLPLNVDHPGPELNPDGQVVDWLEPLVCELEQQAGFTNPLTDKEDILIYKLVNFSYILIPVSPMMIYLNR